MMLKNLLAGALAVAASASAWAHWESDQVDVSFLTTKVTKNHTTVTELNTFKQAKATLNFDGRLTGTVDLNSVDTGIDIRNQRLKEYVFQKVKGGKLLVSGSIDLKDINQLAVGQSLILNQPLHLIFGGQRIDVTARLLVLRQTPDQLYVISLQPLLLDLTLFDVRQALEKLSEIVGLDSIALQVPVVLHARFNRIGQ